MAIHRERARVNLRDPIVVLAFVDHGKRTSTPLADRLTTISKTDLVRCYEFLKSMGVTQIRLMDISKGI